ncbi:YdiU family protein [Pseudothauera nasutitermitis]|uniref:Protein nucleotidyltransferase YdiU n=1 Tax=Pseudothauera nasutitermitis TaxID=2565930 RepID=A0A4S4B1K2_9RHOO|nr:YdiU family protein [Pseudothauera nasutitermitis]THF66441.1 YdiU family protein [Pseudothauera nasutitermitis]
MDHLVFDNRFVRELPADPSAAPGVRQVSGACYSRVLPTPVAAPELLAWSREVADMLGFDEVGGHSPAFAEVFAGNRLLPGMQPYAACYGGHQFGQWAGQLGDGRAISLGEVLTARHGRQELQLKGAGPTPYARHADGRAVLRSSLREFLCSEAMHHLGVPTTRALCLVGTGEEVVRDMFYDGHPRPEPGAVVCRLAPSFVRFGNFEIFTARGELEVLERLADFVIARDFPWIDGSPAERRAAWFLEVCERTARMVAHWMRVGFVHGVMNTDNMSILGLTIDYGPYGWIDNFDPGWTPNTTDAGGRRYRFGHQPRVAHWNLLQLANALYPLFGDVKPLHAGLEHYVASYEAASRRMQADKLGLAEALNDDDADRLDALHRLMTRAEIDMTLFFRYLADVDIGTPSLAPLEEAFYSPQRRAEYGEELLAWLGTHAARLRMENRPVAERVARMHAANPLYVPRNWLAQQAIDAAEQGDLAPTRMLMEVLRRPYEEQPGAQAHAARRPDWARERAGCSMLSCSS